MDDKDYLRTIFAAHVELMQMAATGAVDSLSRASELIFHALLSGHKLIGCGDAAGTSLVRYFCTLLLGRCERRRPGLPAVSLADNTGTLMAIHDEFDPEQVFARQINTLGQAGDILLVVCSAPSRPRISGATAAAHERDLGIVALGPEEDTALERSLLPSDVLIALPGTDQTRNQELNLVYLHALCELIDRQLLGE